MPLIDAFIQKGVLNRYQAELVMKKVPLTEGGLDQVLINAGIQEDAILNIKANYYKVPPKSVDHSRIYEFLHLIPENSARHYYVLPIGLEDNILLVGMVDPGNTEAKNALQFIANKNEMTLRIYTISLSDYKKGMESYQGMTTQNVNINKESSEDYEDLPQDNETESKVSDLRNESNPNSAGKIIEDAPVAKIVAVILRHAIEGRASDIHIEGTSSNVKIRFRVDGVLHTSLLLSSSIHSSLVARIKILSKLKIDEKRRPQDGRFPARIDGRKVDFRVSTFPTAFGEKVVIRILDPDQGVKSLELVGMSPAHAKMVKEALNKPYGLILLTGPTGSGKTTTLYSMLQEINREKKNVVSLEDPVEYLVDGMNQSQVRPEIGYSFANGLRSILRQDPDVIMVGEIRDRETAELAIQSALTGHLVLSTLHTNSAIGVIPRLVDMGIDPYLIAPTLKLTIAQRLVKKMCPEAKTPVNLDESVKMMVRKQFSDLPEEHLSKLNIDRPVYEASQTSDCPTGTRGRIGVFEMFEVDKDLERIILENPTERAIYEKVRSKGMISLKEDAILKCMDGLIGFTEINEL